MSDRDPTEYYRNWTLRLLTGLFKMAGFAPEAAPVARLPESVQRQMRRMLLPLESATRRLVFFIEKRLPETPKREAKPGPTDAEQSRLGYLSAQMKKKKRKRAAKRDGPRAAVFWLFDKARYNPHTADPRRRPPRGGPGPRIWFFDGTDPPREALTEKTPPDRGDARKLCRRMQALLAALNALPDQAVRLRRLMRRGSRQSKPIRDGAAPGYRYDGKGDAFEILRGCHAMAKEPYPPPGV